MTRFIALAVAAIALLHGGAMFVIYLVTRPELGVPARGDRRPAAEAAAGEWAYLPPAPPPAVAPVVFGPQLPANLPAAPPVRVQPPPRPIDEPVPNAAPVLEGPPPAEIATLDADARADAVAEARRRGFASQMEALNRRALRGRPNAVPSEPVTAKPQRGGYTRRGALAAPADPAPAPTPRVVQRPPRSPSLP